MANILPALILYQHRQDVAVGLNYPSRQTREFVYFYEHQINEVQRVFQAAYYNGIIQHGAKELARLTDKAKTNPNKAAAILTEARKIEVAVKKAYKELKRLNV